MIEHIAGNKYRHTDANGKATVFFVPDGVVPDEDFFAAMRAEAATQTVERRAIKDEAARRILALAPEWRQRNAIARGLELLEKRDAGTPLTADEEAERAAIQSMWDAIKAIRERSDDLERTLPNDYQNDAHWR